MRVGSVEPASAVRQHRSYVRALEESGAHVIRIPFVHGAFDSVFSKDNAVVIERANGGREALLARPKYAVRRAEQGARATALERLGIRCYAAGAGHLEGGDVVLSPNATGAFLGCGFRSSARARGDLERFLDRPVTCVELRDPSLYHLDMALSLLDDGTAIVCDDALTRSGIDAVARHPAVRAMVRVPYGEAIRFGVNLVQIDRTLVMGGDAPRTASALRDRGYEVRHVELDQFHRAGGSAACLVSRIHRQSTAASTRTAAA